MSPPNERKRHTPEQVIAKLREAAAMLASGKTIAPVCQSLEVSDVTYHRSKAQFGGMKPDAVKRLKDTATPQVTVSPVGRGHAESTVPPARRLRHFPHHGQVRRPPLSPRWGIGAKYNLE